MLVRVELYPLVAIIYYFRDNSTTEFKLVNMHKIYNDGAAYNENAKITSGNFSLVLNNQAS